MATIRKRFGKWQVQIRRHNYPQIIKSFKEKSTASKYAREIELKMDKQQFEDYSNAAGTTLRDILTRYRDEITPKKKGAKWETYKLNLLIRHKISSLSLLHLNPTALYALKNELSINRKPGTVKHYFSFINNAWNTAERVWGINLPPKNPIKYVILDKVYDRRDRILNEEEYKKLLASASVSNLRILNDMIILAYQTAMRFGEILKLNRKDVDLNKKLITLRDTKNGEDRTIPISNIAIEILRKYPFGLV
jgi:integrase